MGRIELICGPMFSGKTEELLRKVNRFKLSRKNVLLFKPKLDNRYSKSKVTSHNKNSCPAILVDTIDDIISYCEKYSETKVVAIDEIQFIKSNRPLYLDLFSLKMKGYIIILSGLDMDYKGTPFPLIPEIMAIADNVLKLKAVCFICGEDASMSNRLSKKKDLIEIGAIDKYNALCFSCWKNETAGKLD